MSERASVLTGERFLTVCSSTSFSAYGPGGDPRDEVAGEVRQPERCEELARQRAREEEEADGGDGPEAALRLRDDARHVEDERAEAGEQQQVRQVDAEPSLRRGRGAQAPLLRLASAMPAARGVRARGRRHRHLSRGEEGAAQARRAHELADRRRRARRRRARCRRPTPGKRSAKARPMLIASAPDDMSDSPTSGPALRAGARAPRPAASRRRAWRRGAPRWPATAIQGSAGWRWKSRWAPARSERGEEDGALGRRRPSRGARCRCCESERHGDAP